MFAGKYEEGIQAAQRSRLLDEDQKLVITNLALNYVLNNQYENAEPLYKEWMNKKFPESNMSAKDLFLKDIQDLESAKITHPDFSKVRRLLEE